VALTIEGNGGRLTIYPDVERPPHPVQTIDDMQGTQEKPLTILHRSEHPFRLRLSGWERARVEYFENGTWKPVEGPAGSFTARPGEYRLTR
jgi:hypothetical protein